MRKTVEENLNYMRTHKKETALFFGLSTIVGTMAILVIGGIIYGK